MTTNDVAQVIAGYLDGQDIVWPREGELIAVAKEGSNTFVLGIILPPSKAIAFEVKVERI